ncbi:type III secretion system translocon subunit SctE [Cognatiyoonia sp. IB215182]|uniref:type III secretion system translocon subunit SctE n=1 Tax=Cognatiyoonia sp. IB215182 TaxID=3097353 RepID=UPI002A15669D|nr:type III secretion system translocon subunit SctE [Cognatiyoonia sp. IB215182]MDX8355152.1 type III secretion system translocon subunit SctE [Cognatiyoonia sp. IB215182]
MADTTIRETGAVQNITSQTQDVYENSIKVGNGSVASAGPVPDPISQSYEVVSQSLSKFFPTLTGDKIDILVAEVTLQLKEIVGKTDTNELNAKEEQKRQNAAEQRAAAEDAQKALDDAKAAEAKARKSGLFGKIFGGIAAALAIVVGAILIATGVGAVLGAALIVGGVASGMMLADQIVAEKNGGTGMFGLMATKFMEARGFSEEAIERNAAKWDKAFKIVAITAIVLSAVVTMGAGFAASSASAGSAAAGSATGAAAAAGGTTGTVTLTAASNVSRVADLIQKVSTGVSSLAMLGSGVATATTTVFSYQASQDQAEAFRNQADVARTQALNELLNDFIDQILTRISGTTSQFHAMLDEVVASVKDRGDTFARAKFAG